MTMLNKYQNALFVFGAGLVIVGAVLQILRCPEAPYLYTFGALCFAFVQIRAKYTGTNLIIRRLRRQQIIGAILLVVAGVLMFTDQWNIRYLRHNEWALCLFIAAILELYTAFRIPVEVSKEKQIH